MDVENIQLPPPNTKPLTTVRSRSSVRKKVPPWKRFDSSETSTHFGPHYHVVYPVRYPHLEQSEEKKINDLEAPLEAKEEEDDLKRQIIDQADAASVASSSSSTKESNSASYLPPTIDDYAATPPKKKKTTTKLY
jgi:hypothetical protein